jgi:O-antigen/teichoic acid export membrane protein
MMPTATTTKQPPTMKVQAFWLTASKLFAALLNIGLPMLLVRILSQSEYGAYKQAFLFTITASNVATLGVGMSAYYYVPRFPKRGGQIALNILIYNFAAGLVALLALMFYPQVLGLLFPGSGLQPLAILLGILILLTLTAGLVQLMPTALQDVRHSTMFIVGTQLLKTIIFAAVVIAFRSVRSLILGAIVSQIFSMMLLFWYLQNRFPRFWTQFDWEFFKEQLSYALPIGAAGMLWVIQKDLDNYFVGATLGPKEYAIYAIGWLDVPLISLFLESVASVMIIRLAALQHEGRKEEIRRLTASAINRLAAFQFPLCALLLVAGHDLIVLFYTRAYEPSARIFSVTILLLAMSAFLTDPVNRAFKELRKFLLGVNIAIMIVLMSCLMPVIHHFGMMGAAILAVGVQALQKIVLGWKVSRKLDATAKDFLLFKDLFKVTCATVSAGLIAYAVRNLIPANLLVARVGAVGACVVAVYLPAVFLLHLPGREMLSKEKVLALVRSTVARVKGRAQPSDSGSKSEVENSPRH